MSEAGRFLPLNQPRQNLRAVTPQIFAVLLSIIIGKSPGIHKSSEGSINRTGRLVIGKPLKLPVIARKINFRSRYQLPCVVAGALDMFMKRPAEGILLVIIRIGRKRKRRRYHGPPAETSVRIHDLLPP